MDVVLRRVAFGCFWFAAFWVALNVIGGGIATSIAGTRPPPDTASVKKNYSHAPEIDPSASAEFRERYGFYVILGAVALATAGTLAGVLPGTRRR